MTFQKLILGISFFFTFNLQAAESKKLSKSLPTRLISVAGRFTENLTGNVEFSGPLGIWLEASGDKLSEPCIISALFRPAYYQNKNQIEVSLKIKCLAKQQTEIASVLSPPHFFLDEKQKQQNVYFTELSAQFKKIQLQVTEIKITQKQAK